MPFSRVPRGNPETRPACSQRNRRAPSKQIPRRWRSEKCHSRAFRAGIHKHAQLVVNKTGARQTNKSHEGGEVDDDIENIMADIGQDLLEIESSILVLLSALKNEFNPISLIDADNHLELVLGKISETIKKYRNLNDNLKN